ncbi:uncharacterized protein [Parasteatoda tepidariorum]|uniref:uncharacterized protein n=1 Tax=Parasteatoda tepidariorum TaxID=114398 RepID=UPI001C71BAD4|nr:protein transport protein Sec16A [Parasteatoda tepidariorum]
MKIVHNIWVFSLLCCLVNAKKHYRSDPLTQTLHYDDDEPSSSKNNSPYPQITDSNPSSYRHPVELPKSHQYTIPTAPVYRHTHYQQQPNPYGYYTSPRAASYDSYPKIEAPEVESKYPIPQPVPREYHSEEVKDQDYKKPEKKFNEISSEEPEELEYSHGSEEHGQSQEHSAPLPAQKHSHDDDKHIQYPAHKYGHDDDKHTQYPMHKYDHDDDKHAQYSAPAASPYPPPKRDPKLPLYFTMYEKRIIQDPMDKYGKGPWRYLTYGHGITYGSKEPGKVFERGYGYIRALGRDHCKLPDNLCPKRDEKPFEYDGRKEPYFGYRPH